MPRHTSRPRRRWPINTDPTPTTRTRAILGANTVHIPRPDCHCGHPAMIHILAGACGSRQTGLSLRCDCVAYTGIGRPDGSLGPDLGSALNTEGARTQFDDRRHHPNVTPALVSV